MPTLTIAKRELTSLFYSPIAYLVIGVFAFVSSAIFFFAFGTGMQATLRYEFSWLVWLLVFLIPAVSMRVVSEELRTGTIEPLMTAPVSDTQVIVGKWLGALGLFLAMLIPVAVHIVVLTIFSDPDMGPILTGLLGLILVGAVYLAIGVFVSSMTQHQIIAYIITVLITGLLSMGVSMLRGVQWLNTPARRVVEYLSVDTQFEDFSRGVIDLRNFAYFFTGIALFLFLAVKLLESKRWR
jgi:ABC-2 type transport system permease protein